MSGETQAGELDVQHTARRRPRQPRRPLGRLGRGILLRFTFFAVLSILLILAMVGYAGWRQYQDTMSLQQHVTAWIADALDTWIGDIDSSLSAAAAPLLVQIPADSLESALLEVLRRNSSLRSVSLIDAQVGRYGMEIMTVSGAGTTSGANFHGVAWFDDALAQGRAVSRLDIWRSEPVVVVARAVVAADGRPVAVLAARADMRWAYDRLLARAGAGEESYAYIVDSLGTPLLRLGSEFVSTQESRMDIAGIRAATGGQAMPLFYEGLNQEGTAVLGAYTPLRNVSWAVIAEQPLSALGRQLLPLAAGAAGVLLLSAVAAVIVWRYISRRVAAPIGLLREGTRRLAGGDLEQRIDLRARNELAELADDFNRMAASLQESQARQEAWSHELEARVAERTAELSQALALLQAETATREDLLRTIHEMGSPVIPVMEGIIVMPIIGTLDSEQAQHVMDELLAGIDRQRARVAILDITGLAVVDTAVANALLSAAQASQLLGAQAILVGITPAVAETLVQLGVDTHGLLTAATLQEGLRIALHMLRRRIVPL